MIPDFVELFSGSQSAVEPQTSLGTLRSRNGVKVGHSGQGTGSRRDTQVKERGQGGTLRSRNEVKEGYSDQRTGSRDTQVKERGQGGRERDKKRDRKETDI